MVNKFFAHPDVRLMSNDDLLEQFNASELDNYLEQKHFKSIIELMKE